jgi:hypothetical protein
VRPEEKKKMSATQILNGLERSETTGSDADAVARLGFLEWVFEQEGSVTAADAREALASPEAQGAGSAAARAFVGYLFDAAQSVPLPSGRRRSRRAVH